MPLEEKSSITTINNKLTYKSGLKSICKRVNQKINALVSSSIQPSEINQAGRVKIPNLTSPSKTKTLTITLIKYHLLYYSKLWVDQFQTAINLLGWNAWQVTWKDHPSKIHWPSANRSLKSLNGYSPDFMRFLIYEKILITSNTFMPLILMFLEIIICTSSPFKWEKMYWEPWLLSWKNHTH